MKPPFTIGITGASGSGKTTFIRQIRSIFSEDEVCIVSQDDYYRPRAEQSTDENGVSNFDLPESLFREDFYEDVKKLRLWQTVTREEYTFNNEQAKPEIHVFRPAPILILEGIFVFHYPEVRNLLDLRLFLHAKEDLKVIRRIKRDREERNYPLEDVLYRYAHHVSPAFDRYIKPYQDEADIVINNNRRFDVGFEVLKGYMQTTLAAYKADQTPLK
ncbi:MAG: uridine kinase [Saprospirales bacterium]|nr:uridine kinase [Saprospirales bacterium]